MSGMTDATGANPGDGLDVFPLLTARRFARFCPSSLLASDLELPKRVLSSPSLQNTGLENKDYIRPSSIVTVEKRVDEKNNYAPSPFDFLIDRKRRATRARPSFRMRYELPNVRRVDPISKGRRSFCVVSLSSDDLSRCLNGTSSSGASNVSGVGSDGRQSAVAGWVPLCESPELPTAGAIVSETSDC